VTALLVTGSRSLASHRESEYRSRVVIEWAIRSLDVGVVFVGDAAGPDTWAAHAAMEHGIAVERFQLDGMIYRSLGQSSRWSFDSGRRYRDRTWPLERNRAMVGVAKRCLDDGNATACLALIDPTSRTKGTEHTAGLAGRAGLRVVRCVYGA
jgi:hypothetical protein